MDSLAMRRAEEEIASHEEEKRRAEEKSAYEAKLKHLESHAIASGKSPALPQYNSCEAFFADHERAILEEMMYLKTNGESASGF